MQYFKSFNSFVAEKEIKSFSDSGHVTENYKNEKDAEAIEKVHESSQKKMFTVHQMRQAFEEGLYKGRSTSYGADGQSELFHDFLSTILSVKDLNTISKDM